MRMRRGMGALLALAPVVAVVALVHCGGGVREDAVVDAGIEAATRDADASEGDAAPAQCIPAERSA